MPWFPDFVAPVELVRRDIRAEGRADPVARYLEALSSGDARALETVWPGEIVVFDPKAGEVRGHGPLRLAHDSQVWFEAHRGSTEIVASTSVPGRAVVEVLAHVHVDGEQMLWPLAVVAESADEPSVTFRTYCSQVPVVGHCPVRAPILPTSGAALDGLIGHYLAAERAGDVDAILAAFAPDGCYREPIGRQPFHRGRRELRTYFAGLLEAGGGVGLERCAVTDDGTRCALEYNCVSWGGHDVPPQAGIVVFERDAGGLLVAVRVYDDVEAPVERA